MMLIRRQIATICPFSITIAISTAVKYSIKRKQFKELGK